MTEDGLYVMFYTQWNRQVARLAVATSRDLISWQKHGSIFAQAYGGRFKDNFTKSASIVTKMKDGKQVAVPKCYGDEMRFIYMDDLSKVEKGYANIPEPIADGPVADDTTALVLMPGLAFDPQGHRIGYGGGFYDRFLADEPDHPTLALCYGFQMVEHLETEEFDIPVDQVLWADPEEE